MNAIDTFLFREDVRGLISATSLTLLTVSSFKPMAESNLFIILKLKVKTQQAFILFLFTALMITRSKILITRKS